MPASERRQMELRLPECGEVVPEVPRERLEEVVAALAELLIAGVGNTAAEAKEEGA